MLVALDNQARDAFARGFYTVIAVVATIGTALFLGFLIGQYIILSLTQSDGELVGPETSVTSPSKQPALTVQERGTPGVSKEGISSGADERRDQALADRGRAEASYRVQVGAFSTLQNAENFAKELEKLGYSVYITPGDLYRVRVGDFPIKREAERVAEELKKQGYHKPFVVELE